jgi:multicomponent Na+:H+ antiporter subunit G
MSDTIAGLLILLGGAFGVIGALGLLRMPDILIRMHASTKIGTLSCGLIAAATAVYFADAGTAVRAVLIILFLLLTAPIAAHMIGRAAVASGVPLWRGDFGADPRDGTPPDTPSPSAARRAQGGSVAAANPKRGDPNEMSD